MWSSKRNWMKDIKIRIKNNKTTLRDAYKKWDKNQQDLHKFKMIMETSNKKRLTMMSGIFQNLTWHLAKIPKMNKLLCKNNNLKCLNQVKIFRDNIIMSIKMRLVIWRFKSSINYLRGFRSKLVAIMLWSQ